MASEVIRPSGPFDLALTLKRGQSFRWEAPTRRRRYYEGVVLGNIVRVRERKEHGDIEFVSYPEPPVDFKPKFEDYLGLSHDLDEVYDALGDDPVLEPLLKKYSGMRILRQDPWECLITFMCTRTASLDRTSQMVENISRVFGEKIVIPPQKESWYRFPCPDELSVTGDHRRHLDVGTGFRTEDILCASRLVAMGGLELDNLRQASYMDARRALTRLSGVGDKIADCVLLYSLDKFEAFPVDRHIQHIVKDRYSSTRFYESIGKWARNRFGHHAGYAQLYLFCDSLL